jgi:two-component system response regulator BaeR
MSQHILIVEDEVKLASLLQDYLIQSGFDVTTLNDGALVQPWLAEHHTNLVLLDLMLPNKSGVEICKEIRKHSQLPVIMITAKIDEIDRLLGLELGADDYICKPFSPREVVARVKTVLRRAGDRHQAPPTGELALDAEKYRAVLHGQDLELTAVEFKLLHFLYQNPGRIYSRSQLMDRIYSDQRIVSDRTIDSHIKKLRKKIATAAADEELIHSIYGVGYKFEAP